jgi:glycosyltransferase involved in cell wall biosynthesis
VVDGAGVLAEREDHDGIGEALARLGGDPELRRALGTTARTHVAGRYRADALVERMTVLYEGLLAERSVARATVRHP